MQQALRFIRVFAFMAAAAAGAAVAADLPKQGRYDITACWSGVGNQIAFSKTHTASSFEMTGTNRSNPPGGLFDKNSFRCVGMSARLGERSVGSVVCEAVDPDGDKRLSYFGLGSDGKYVREQVAGTGKYDGMTTDGTVQPLGPFPTLKEGTFQSCNHQTGTYKLK